ncbi:MAG TPA: PIN domain-containing protein [Acidimicrobiales bacterium]|jgi:predicted nucleic acid-binding protein|nr:PIN domain-containing protein [Acidimicrobiales bacterium]
MDAFGADVLIYAAAPDHPLGAPVLALFPREPLNDASIVAGVGSTLLLPEVLTKPTRDGIDNEVASLTALLARLDLRPVDEAIAALAVALGASYGLRSPDAVHLATAVSAGADRFITNNRRDFPQSIEEVSVTYPTDLP